MRVWEGEEAVAAVQYKARPPPHTHSPRPLLAHAPRPLPSVGCQSAFDRHRHDRRARKRWLGEIAPAPVRFALRSDPTAQVAPGVVSQPPVTHPSEPAAAPTGWPTTAAVGTPAGVRPPRTPSPAGPRPTSASPTAPEQPSYSPSGMPSESPTAGGSRAPTVGPSVQTALGHTAPERSAISASNSPRWGAVLATWLSLQVALGILRAIH